MKIFKMLFILMVTLGLPGMVVLSQAALLNPLTTIELETPVHFLAPDGSDLVVDAGTYIIEPAEEWIRLMSGERYEAVLIEAKKGTHEMELEHAMALSLPGEAEKEGDLHHVMLLLPGGNSLEATGTYSGIHPRGFFNKTFSKAKKNANRAYKKARSTNKKAISKTKSKVNAALHAKRQIEKRARREAAKVRRSLPKMRSLSAKEKNLARTVFRNTINYDRVKITNTLGAGGRPWTTNTPPMYMINVGSDYPNLTANDDRRRLLIHELAHVWQGQHLVPFMLNSFAHQTLGVIRNGGDVASAYSYRVGKPWRKYNVEQQASIVAHWFTPADICFENGPCGGGMKTTDSRYRYIRDHIRKNKAK